MNYRNAAVVSVVASLMAGCAYIPAGHSSRSGAGRIEVDSTEKLFSNDPALQAGVGDASNALAGSAPGLKVRKSKRGNMDSYVVRGQRYFTLDESDGYSARGLASWYGPNFHGRTASNGEVYDMYQMTAAHKTLPLPTFARVTHIDNGKSIVVKINDRGPFSGDRIIDLSFAAALELGMVNDGTAMVEIQAISAEELVSLSGPKNTLGVDFYYDAGSETRNASLPSSELFVDDGAPAEGVIVTVGEENSVEGQSVPLAGVGELQLPVAAMPESLLPPLSSVAGVTPNVVNSGSQSAPDGVVVVVPKSVKPEYLEVVVPGRQRPDTQVAALSTAADSGIFPAEGIDAAKLPPATLPPVPSQTGLEAVPQRQVPASLLDTAAVSPLAVAAVPAIVAPGKGVPKTGPVSSIRYYIQAGVYADVLDAERIAVDIVLEIPEEEVHVKPLKDSHLYRVTVGPIMKSEHAKAVAAKLAETGLENYTVKVNEI